MIGERNLLFQSPDYTNTIYAQAQYGFPIVCLGWVFYPKAGGVVYLDWETGQSTLTSDQVVYLNTADSMPIFDTDSSNSIYKQTNSYYWINLIGDLLLGADKPKANLSNVWGYSFGSQTVSKVIRSLADTRFAVVEKGKPIIFIAIANNNYTSSSRAYNFTGFHVKVLGEEIF